MIKQLSGGTEKNVETVRTVWPTFEPGTFRKDYETGFANRVVERLNLTFVFPSVNQRQMLQLSS
jgi:hypothetical protein